MTTKKLEKTSPNLVCENLDLKCFTTTDWNIHIARPKHIKTTNNNEKNLKPKNRLKIAWVLCEKTYIHNQ
jgi:hypothetical protein